jgi:phospholipid/cholesterol/gamma-HCH transport system substrate-binding protein
MRTPLTRFERITGIFLAVAVLLGFVGLIIVARTKDLGDYFRPDVRFFVLTSDGKGLAPGSSVRFHGIEIGSVEKVNLARDPAHPGKDVRLTVAVKQRDLEFLSDHTKVSIDDPPFGAAALDLESEGAGTLKRGAVLVAEEKDSLSEALRRTATQLTGLGGQVGESLGELHAILADVHRITDAIAAGRGLAGSALTDEQAASDLRASLANVRQATEQGLQASTRINELSAQTLAMTSSLGDMSKRVDAVFAKLEPLADKMPEVAASVQRTLENTEALTANLKTASGYAPALARKANVSLDETNRLIEGVQRNFIVSATMPDRPKLRTEGTLRPSAALSLDGGTP